MAAQVGTAQPDRLLFCCCDSPGCNHNYSWLPGPAPRHGVGGDEEGEVDSEGSDTVTRVLLAVVVLCAVVLVCLLLALGLYCAVRSRYWPLSPVYTMCGDHVSAPCQHKKPVTCTPAWLGEAL